MSNEKEVMGLLATLAGTLRQEVTEPMIAGFCLALADMSEPELRKAFARALTECKFFPSPAELCAFAGRKALADRGPEAWAIVRGAMDRFDYTDGVDFGPLVNAVVADLGGWQYLCDCSLPDLVWREKEFIAKFQDRANRPPDEYRGKPHRGALAASPLHAIAAPGSDGPKLIENAARRDVSDLIRQLADSKAT